MKDSKTDPGRLLSCGLSWIMLDGRMEDPLITIDSNVHLAGRRAEPNQMNSVFDALSLSQLFVIDTTDAVDKPGCEVVHVVDDTVVVDLHVIGISMNGEAVLVSDTDDICCKKDEICTTVRAPSLEVRRIPPRIFQTSDRCSVRIVSYL